MGYDRRIIVQESTETVSDSGAVISTWDDLFEVWAKVEPLQGREYYSGAQPITERIYLFKTQYSTAAAEIAPPRHRINFGDRNYDIESVIDFNDRHRELHIRCVQRD
jgi:SPP1 family predicted phage head-tail adaptor